MRFLLYGALAPEAKDYVGCTEAVKDFQIGLSKRSCLRFIKGCCMAFDYYWWDPFGDIKEQIEKWSPRKCKTEKEYENSLARYLRSNFEDIDIVQQYAIGRSRADIVIEEEILLEIKVGLDATTKLDRLIGQIEKYEGKWDKPIIVVLCGKHDPSLLRQLEQYIEKKSGFFSSKKIGLVLR